MNRNLAARNGLAYSRFVVPLVKAVQELNAQKTELADHLAEANARLDVQQQELKELRQLVLQVTQQPNSHASK